MPRIGRHPLKDRHLMMDEPDVQKITVTTITHIPELEGYWAESLEVLKLFIQSLRVNTKLPFDLMVFDNASCQEVTDYLTQLKSAGMIQYLVLSDRNFRKLGALDYILRAAPGEIVAYADSDVYFLPGWLEQSIRILDAFPQAGMVSAIPTIDKSEKFLDSTLRGVEEDPAIEVETGPALIPEAFVRAHRLSLGKTEADYFSGERFDTRVTHGGTSAFASAQDFQFITRREVIQDVLPLRLDKSVEDYDPIYSPVFEKKVDQKGWWRLSTCNYLVHHMGNHVPDLTEELKGLASELDIVSRGIAPENKPDELKQKRLSDSWLVRKVLKKIYTWSYMQLFEKKP